MTAFTGSSYFGEMKSMKIEKCRICSAPDLEACIDLGRQPWCNDFITADQVGLEITYPLEACFCNNCGTLQVSYTVPKEIMYCEHTYLSGATKTMKAHFQKVSDFVCYSLVKTKGLVVDIGSNDGTLLSTYRNNDMDVLGIEACKKPAEIAMQSGIATEIGFFNYDYAVDIAQRRGKAMVMSAANVFYHIEDLHSVTRGVSYLLDQDGVFVVQASYLPRLIESKAFDIMYHEHLLYYRVENLKYLLNLYKLEIFEIDEAPVHGGSIVAYICHKGKRPISGKVKQMIESEHLHEYHKIDKYKKFNDDISAMREKLVQLIGELKGAGKKIYAYGAPAKGTVLLNFYGLTRKEIDLAVEVNHLKFDRYIPCTNIPIVDERTVDEPDYYLLLSWNFAEEFFRSEAYQSGSRKFIIPVPEPKIYHK